MTDEEVHAIAALLRGNSTIAELNLRGNEVLHCRVVYSVVCAHLRDKTSTHAREHRCEQRDRVGAGIREVASHSLAVLFPTLTIA